ncbi:MAG: Zn-ribbon domain-containing OB-fold protein [Acidimicrobiia bacterium]
MNIDLTNTDFELSPSPDSAAFWEGVQRRELLLPWCTPCDAAFWYPRTACPRCGSRDIEWRAASGDATVHSFCIHFHSALPHLAGLTPFVTALVDLDEGPRMMGLLDVEPDPSAIRCDVPVVVTFATTAGGALIPVFAPHP